MDAKTAEFPAVHTGPAEEQGVAAGLSSTNVDVKPSEQRNTSPEAERHKHRHKSKKKASKKSKKPIVAEESSSSSDSSDDEDSRKVSKYSSSSSSSSSESEKHKKKKKKKKKEAAKKQKKQKKHSKHRTVTSDSESSDSESSDDESSETERKQRRRRKGRSQKRQSLEDPNYDSAEEEDGALDSNQEMQLNALANQQAALMGSRRRSNMIQRGATHQLSHRIRRVPTQEPSLPDIDDSPRRKSKKKNKKQASTKRASTLEFKRVDQLWDNTIHNYKLTESAQDQEDEFDQYVFTVRRRFDWENKYKNTVVDVKSKLLRDALHEIMKDVKGVSLVEDRPSVDPNMLFLYLEEIRRYAKKTLKAKLQSEKKRKNKKKISLTKAELKVLISYLDQDYEETKKTLYPMLEAGNITFELLWALFKPNSIAYTPTYGNTEEPRCFKVDYATKESSFMRGEWYSIEGRYLEYDGKSFGLGDFEAQIDAFKGPRKITSLASYPLAYHKDPESVKKQLIERGKRFVSMEGMNYRYHQGMAFMKKKKVVAKVNINGRIMVDPAIFRRVNPNYQISTIKPKDQDEGYLFSDSEDSDCCCCSSCDEDQYGNKGDDIEDAHMPPDDQGPKERTKFKVIKDKDDNTQIVQVTVDENGQEEHVENLDKLPEGVDPKHRREFTEEELIIASPVVLGFAFSEKLWLEFTISGLRGIEWNEGAFDSLVLPSNQKSIVRALVESHKFHAAKTIDDVVQGKGKGLVAVLHGPPGTGKTLTAEGIAELLKCPLYMVSAGELGTDPRLLEGELQKILDIAHSWGAVLLLDEADVFLERREVHDIHRNALVSIFLRLLEYFQGILFLTTNRVETFDDAFQSRIHVALRYGELTTKAKKAVWKMFLGKVREMEQKHPNNETDTVVVEEGKNSTSIAKTEKSSASPSVHFKESDYDSLARRPLNGRQIKNVVRTSQALAVNRKESLAMHHILEVLEVAESFEHDLKGGTGYMDAMRSYT